MCPETVMDLGNFEKSVAALRDNLTARRLFLAKAGKTDGDALIANAIGENPVELAEKFLPELRELIERLGH
jgi:hypothetical protein